MPEGGLHEIRGILGESCATLCGFIWRCHKLRGWMDRTKFLVLFVEPRTVRSICRGLHLSAFVD